MELRRNRSANHSMTSNKKSLRHSRGKENSTFTSQNHDLSDGGDFTLAPSAHLRSGGHKSARASMYSINHANSVNEFSDVKLNQSLNRSGRKPPVVRSEEPSGTNMQLLLQELRNCRKNLIESQARNAASAKEIGRLQHELNLMGIKHTSLKVSGSALSRPRRKGTRSW